ncbi:methyl-accepting chemotaxis protein [Rhodoferax sp.]|uniref:methyl-accepting chemotaxis protein n=1 Tax=Rhodoferax sp. TaxID=50421 RepID=UPI003455ED08
MRNNHPVTGKVYTFPSDQTLISVTDTKGRITYCNNNFIMVSGYTREELLGQPHNILRHPDMPAEAFRDMWATIEGGKPWSALVKNRRKNGDHYWVRANATPVRRDGQIVGYLSVRSAPAEAEIAPAESLYATMRQEVASGRLVHCLRHGEVVRNTVLGRLIHRLRPGPVARMGLLFLPPVLVPVLVSALNGPVWAALIAALMAALVATVLAWRLNIQPLTGVLDVANRLAAGDLVKGVEVNESGLIGQLQLALAQLAVSVRTVVRDVRHEVANLRGGSQEIATGNLDLSSRTESQASSLEQTAASMEEISGTIKQTSQLANQGATLASEAAGMSRRSHEAVQAVAGTMKDIARASDQIGNIIQVIDGVAFQTNILALNAAVEAARAGDQGRGFAVVAAEVRALAQRTSTAAREVKELIEASIGCVEAGARQTAHAQSRMDETMAAVEKTAALLAEIRNAMTEQEIGVTHVNDAVAHLDSLTQQNAAMVEELAAAAKSMDDQVVMVHNSIRVFRLTDRDVTLAEADAVELRKQYQKEVVDEGSIDFDASIAKHQQWRVTLRNAVLKRTQLDANQIRRDDCCDLGKWIYGGGSRRWGNMPDFARLVEAHKTFHNEAAKVADVANRGQSDQANQMLETGSSFVEAGKRVVQALRDIRSRVEAGVQIPAQSKLLSANPPSEDWATF